MLSKVGVSNTLAMREAGGRYTDAHPCASSEHSMTAAAAIPLEAVRGACGHDCPDTCSWVVEVKDGNALRLSGDPAHPFTRGTLCAKVNHYLERVHHPDRVLHPLKRTGRKGDGQFVRVSWDEALADIASRWRTIAAESGAEAILPYSSAGVQGLVQMASLDRRLFGSMGCSDLDRNICGAVAAAGLKATLGCGTGIDPEEIVHSRFIVLWGTNTIVTNLHYWPRVREAQRRGARGEDRSRIRCARAPRRWPTGTCRSSPRATRRWRSR